VRPKGDYLPPANWSPDKIQKITLGKNTEAMLTESECDTKNKG